MQLVLSDCAEDYSTAVLRAASRYGEWAKPGADSWGRPRVPGTLAGVMTSQVIPPIYKLHIGIRQISPMIWRRILVRRESSIAQLHDIIQIAFGWSDSHLHRF